MGNELKVLGPLGAKFQWLTLRVSRSPSCKVTESQDLEDSNFEGYINYIGIYEISQNYLQGLKRQRDIEILVPLLAMLTLSAMLTLLVMLTSFNV